MERPEWSGMAEEVDHPRPGCVYMSREEEMCEFVCVCVRVCVCERESPGVRMRERERGRGRRLSSQRIIIGLKSMPDKNRVVHPGISIFKSDQHSSSQ